MPESIMPAPAYQFPGFFTPRFTQVPDDLFDELMPHLSGAELKVLLYIIRRTYGFKKDSDNISLGQLVDGITTREGKQLDHGTGLARSSVLTALKGLTSKGCIVARRNSSLDRGDEPTTYYLHERRGAENTTPGVQGSGSVRAGLSAPQDTVVQETGGQETSNRRADPLSEADKDVAWNRDVIDRYVKDFRREFNDHARAGSSTARAIRLFEESGLDIDAYSKAMYRARVATKANGTHKDKPMAYWFACLEQELKVPG